MSYAWALKVPDDAPSSDGLSWARLLAKKALEWRQEALRGGPRPYPLTAAELATDLGVSATTVRRRVAEARTAFFGSLSDSAIYYRLAHAREGEREEAMCAAPDCQNKLPPGRTRRRAYCHPRCRRRHHYQRHTAGARPRPHLRGERKRTAGSEEARPDTREQLESTWEVLLGPRP
jgi:hypothetical protein